jgi:hypothetical protein
MTMYPDDPALQQVQNVGLDELWTALGRGFLERERLSLGRILYGTGDAFMENTWTVRL